jgi:hypothetical protein
MFRQIPLPTGFAHARDQSLVGEFAKTNPANAELPVNGPRAAAHLAPPPDSRRKFLRLLRPGNFRFAGHVWSLKMDAHGNQNLKQQTSNLKPIQTSNRD